jgi:hypothetical protein
MLSQITAYLYGVGCYLAFFATFLQAIGFIGPAWRQVSRVVLSDQTKCKCITDEMDRPFRAPNGAPSISYGTNQPQETTSESSEVMVSENSRKESASPKDITTRAES